MAIFFANSIDKDLFQIYNNKNIELFSKDIIDISLKAYQYIC